MAESNLVRFPEYCRSSRDIVAIEPHMSNDIKEFKGVDVELLEIINGYDRGSAKNLYRDIRKSLFYPAVGRIALKIGKCLNGFKVMATGLAQ